MSWLCSLPWTGFSNDPDGKVRPCCIYKGHITDESGNAYYVQTTSVKDIFKSKYMRDLRQQFLSGDKPAGCETCIRDEFNNFKSKRQRYMEFLKGNLTLFESEPELPVEYQMILSNACNLKCRSCTPSHSNLWQAEHKILFGDSGYSMPHGQSGNNESVLWKDRHEWMSYVKRLEIVGGEPFYIKQWKDLWKEMIDLGYSKNIVIDMSTNCNIFDRESLDLITANFKRVGIGLSIDGLGSVYDYLRYPGKWETVEKNILEYYRFFQSSKIYRLLRFSKKDSAISYTHTIGWINAWYLPEFHRWCRKNTPGVRIWNNIIHYPDHMSLWMLPKSAKNIILEKWNSFDWGEYSNDINGLTKFMQSVDPDEDTIRRAYLKFKPNDLHRNESIRSVIAPELLNIISEYIYDEDQRN